MSARWSRRRRLTDRYVGYVRRQGWKRRCEHCSRRFLPSHSRHSYGGNRATYHDVRISYTTWRSKAGERLAILDLISEVWNIDAATVRDLAANRNPDGYKSSNEWNRAWRVSTTLRITVRRWSHEPRLLQAPGASQQGALRSLRS